MERISVVALLVLTPDTVGVEVLPLARAGRDTFVSHGVVATLTTPNIEIAGVPQALENVAVTVELNPPDAFAYQTSYIFWPSGEVL
jgi:hypothetical protein